ncbi:MAG: Single-stranded nucleic acid binding R3H domain protein [Candidatus Yanofskybacteria bacterium GW2011_GWC2_41_9]|uniref:Single-stranded nucleic acid binding R3H domain protein n=1 Tax=Candidatus Yanofskybacteria bacterium GW2011_GWC2_41_9 TaxID=1619029 RepID=A0A0G0XRI8_9BACT|nr:MAG: Single-stranded nucleic acid binding R3H domain protein [Candidatus Yanofskybacteria bacterium GW2011_GWC2_41_9]
MGKLDEVKNIVNEFWKRAGILDFEIKAVEAATDGSLNIGIFIRDASLYIGEEGRNIKDFETILRLVIKKQIGDVFTVHLDINNYREFKNEALRELAKKAARRARFYKQPVALEAMSAYERRIIHTELAVHPDIKTESTGEGNNRRVVVKYIS